MRLVRVLVAALLVGGPVVATETVADAAPVWSISPSPSPLGPPTGALHGVSCPTATTCFAVGEYNSMSLTKSLVERWNGTSWSILPSPNPAGANRTTLRDVSCVSATSCFAVGNTTGSQTVGTHVQRWNGTAWSIVPSPTPAGAGHRAFLFSVSCASATSCIAVGQYEVNSIVKTLVERWNGSNWVIVASPNPAGASSAYLGSVSCVSANSCLAVGGYYIAGASAAHPLVERWNGTSWSIIAAPGGAASPNLVGVDCENATLCFAVGNAEVGSGTQTFVGRWNGTSWSTVASPNPPGSVRSQLEDVSCSSATSCFAVGLSSSDSPEFSNDFVTMAQAWNGTSWSIVSTPNPVNSAQRYLGSVSCSDATSCLAVGSYEPDAFDDQTTATLAERWNGTAWSITAPPTGASRSELLGVACPSTTSCFAVGDFFAGGATKPLLERWNGTAWSILPGPAVDPTSIVAKLNGVSCASSTSCFAVGSYSTSTTTKTLIERWNGTSWSVVPSPNPAGATSSILNGVSCVSATNCVAVGTYIAANNWRTFVQRWNGTGWSILGIPNPGTRNKNILHGVSCVSTTSCVAVGQTGESAASPLIAHWNGTSWSIVPSPTPAGSFTARFFGVSCFSSANCTAVGMHGTPEGAAKTLAERWNGTSWTVVPSANRPPQSTVFNSVSCSSATSCYAVGYSILDAITPSSTLVETWNGTSFAIVTTPNPAGSTRNFLQAIDCVSATACTAVGGYEARGSRLTLVERYA